MLDGERTAVAEKSKPQVPGSELDRGDGSLVVEAVVKIDRANTAGVIAGKLDAAGGYAQRLAGGKPEFLERSAAGEALVTGPARIDDGAWHHILVEADRATGELRVHVDGKTVASSSAPAVLAAASTCPAGFTAGVVVVGAIDFLRVARGSLADAQTTIAELYAWEFDGPQFRDFAGRKITGKFRDIGALEAP